MPQSASFGGVLKPRRRARKVMTSDQDPRAQSMLATQMLTLRLSQRTTARRLPIPKVVMVAVPNHIKITNFSFMNCWDAKYVNDSTLSFPIDQITGFSESTTTFMITHGYGVRMTVEAYKVHGPREEWFKVVWTENMSQNPKIYTVNTASLTAALQRISRSSVSDYLDLYIDQPDTYRKFANDYFQSAPSLSKMLKKAHRYWSQKELPIIKKALKLILAFSFTFHITLAEDVSDEEDCGGEVTEKTSWFYGKKMAPAMISLQTKQAMTDVCRGLHEDTRVGFSSLYMSVDNNDTPEHKKTVRILATILLAVSECRDTLHRLGDNASQCCRWPIPGHFSEISEKQTEAALLKRICLPERAEIPPKDGAWMCGHCYAAALQYKRNLDP